MAEESSSGLRPFPVRVIKWLGHNILEEHPAIRMLHEARASETAREKSLPLEQRASYKLRKARIFASGANTYTGADANEIAMSPQEKAAAQAAAAAAAAEAAAAQAAAQAAADAGAPLPPVGEENAAG